MMYLVTKFYTAYPHTGKERAFFVSGSKVDIKNMVWKPRKLNFVDFAVFRQIREKSKSHSSTNFSLMSYDRSFKFCMEVAHIKRSKKIILNKQWLP